ncbi:site-specific integrase [Lusitaniella coriacea LEGE 07157]|uniref:Site-specific integrase n=1 Tax=Lusitaniella coriacea LEGE 07157 TaxID=945747 RepID=A0A8J7E176_9CYAN|nr:site-specific integrase [Lusitaniella coriacea]MBE9118636.1 site-specific integrase [Lusitaniella coriacea LEGE 07157]
MRPPLVLDDPEDLSLGVPLSLAQHPARVYLDSLAPGSRPTMKQSLDAIARLLTSGQCDGDTLDWAKLRYRHTSALRTALKVRYAPATASKMLCALRRVLKEALRLDLIDPLDYSKAVDLGRIKETRTLRGRALSSEEIAALMATCDLARPIDLRDAALMAILRGAGLRRAEVAALAVRDFDPETGALAVRRGKGNKDRTAYLPSGAISFLRAWLAVRGEAPGALLCPIRKGGHLEIRAMCADAVLKILRRRAKQAGIEAFSPHDFRRTFCSDLLDAGVDIVTVQKLAGHASPATTAKYDRRGEETKRRAVQKLRF